MNEKTEQKPQPMTFASAIDWLETASLQPRDKRDIRSAIETSCKWFKSTPASVPLDPPLIRRLFKSVSPGGCGVTKEALREREIEHPAAARTHVR